MILEAHCRCTSCCNRRKFIASWASGQHSFLIVIFLTRDSTQFIGTVELENDGNDENIKKLKLLNIQEDEEIL